jgi:hypothetical protein
MGPISVFADFVLIDCVRIKRVWTGSPPGDGAAAGVGAADGVGGALAGAALSMGATMRTSLSSVFGSRTSAPPVAVARFCRGAKISADPGGEGSTTTTFTEFDLQKSMVWLNWLRIAPGPPFTDARASGAGLSRTISRRRFPGRRASP